VLRCRENIPLAVMSVISLAVLFIFGVSELAMRATPRQLNSCGVSQQASIPIGWNDDASFPPGFIEPCIPTLAAKPPFGPGWVHEIKHTAIG
jgi:hypothetical protein